MKSFLSSCLLAAMAFSCHYSNAQTVVVGPSDQYAFQWENFGGSLTNIGLYFSQSQQEFQFRDGSGGTRLSINPSNGQIKLGDNTTNYARFNSNGDLRFFGNADYLVDNNDYAFRSNSDPDNGLFFNVTDNRYEFRSNTATGSFWITANTSGGATSGGFHSDGDGDINGDLVVKGEGTYSSFANNSSTNDGPLAVGPRTSSHIAFDNNEVQSYSGTTATGTFYSQYYGGNMDICNNVGGGNLTVSSGALYVRGSDNKVGIGTTAPGATLHVATGVDAALSTNGYQMWGSQTGLNVIIDNNELMAKNNGTAANLTINQDGGDVVFGGASDIDVGVGTTAPAYTMHLSYPTGVTGHGLGIQNESAAGAWQLYAFSSGDLDLYYNGVNKGGFDDVSGNYIPSSDIRYKDDIEKIDGGMLDLIKQLEPATYHFQADQIRERKYYGLIAQEVKEVMPSLVHYWDEEDRYGVSYTELIPVIIEAMQELDSKVETGGDAARVAELEVENTELNSRVDRLEDMLEEMRTAISACCSVDIEPIQEAREASEGAYLGQNIPNPFEGVSMIPYFLPEGAAAAVITVTDITGKVVRTYEVSGAGFGQVEVDPSGLASGTYIYNMIVEGRQIGAKRMVLAQ